MNGLVDIHCHILPGLDDGPATIEESVAMARVAQADGITTAVATPHALDGVFDITAQARDAALQSLRERLRGDGISLELLPGSDCHLHEDLLARMLASPELSLGGAGQAFLVEWPDGIIPVGFRTLLFESQVHDLEVVLTHPERHSEVQESPGMIADLVEAGMRVQISAGSLTGGFDGRARRTAERLLGDGLVYLIASDAHDAEVRRPVLTQGLAEAERLVGASAIDLVTTNPESLIRG